MEIKMTDNAKEFEKLLIAHKKQIPFAASRAQNIAANQAAKAQRSLAARKIDRPNPFTLNHKDNPKRSGFVLSSPVRSQIRRIYR